MNKTIRFGVVGTNFVSDSFMDGVKMTEGIDVVAVCSGRKENAVRFAGSYQIPYIFDSYQEMASSDIIDAVYIATPNALHYEHARYFLERKIAVFLEKPLTVNEHQAIKLFEVARKNNTYLHDGIMPLYSPNLNILRESMKNIGPIRRVVLSFQKYSSRYDAFLRNENPTTFRKDLANGAFMDLGVYTIADAVALFGKPKKISSSAFLLSTGVDGLNTAILHYDGFDAVIMNSKITNSEVLSEIQGEKGLIQFSAPSTLDFIVQTSLKKEQIHFDVSKVNPFYHQLCDFKDSYHNSLIESTKVPHQLSIDIIETLTSCRQMCGIFYDDDMS